MISIAIYVTIVIQLRKINKGDKYVGCETMKHFISYK